MKTHRCKESLRQEISIRFEDGKWWLNKIETNWDWAEIQFYLKRQFEIKYCPFCGYELEESE